MGVSELNDGGAAIGFFGFRVTKGLKEGVKRVVGIFELCWGIGIKGREGVKGGSAFEGAWLRDRLWSGGKGFDLIGRVLGEWLNKSDRVWRALQEGILRAIAARGNDAAREDHEGQQEGHQVFGFVWFAVFFVGAVWLVWGDLSV